MIYPVYRKSDPEQESYGDIRLFVFEKPAVEENVKVHYRYRSEHHIIFKSSCEIEAKHRAAGACRSAERAGKSRQKQKDAFCARKPTQCRINHIGKRCKELYFKIIYFSHRLCLFRSSEYAESRAFRQHNRAKVSSLRRRTPEPSRETRGSERQSRGYGRSLRR